MLSPPLRIHHGLGTCGRVRTIRETDRAISAVELGFLLMLGVVTAAISAFVKPSFGVPGSNIICVVFPMALGLALVPRGGAASVMGLSATASAGLFCLAGSRLGAGAATSLALTGLLIDLALLGARSGRGIYVRLTAAGLAANMAAFLIRAGTKLVLGPGVTGKPLTFWWQHALVTYAVCGLLAGMLSAAVWFRFGGGKVHPGGGAAR